jgi:hypothetical protein
MDSKYAKLEMMTMSKSLRLSMIATLLLATTVLAVMSYNILNPKEPEPKAAEAAPVPVPPPPEPPKKKVVWRSAREEPPSIRIITPNKEGGSTVKKCWNFECE